MLRLWSIQEATCIKATILVVTTFRGAHLVLGALAEGRQELTITVLSIIGWYY